MTRPVALSIAGSDSGGGAGIQADLRTFSSLGVFGTTVLTALTAQNLQGVSSVLAVAPDFVAAQLEAVLRGFPVAAIKTGMLWSAEIIERVAAVLAGRGQPLVVDPVMVASSGDRLLRADAVEAYRRRLLPTASLVTPNLDEAAVLLGGPRIAAEQMAEAAQTLAGELGCAVLLKGGHLDGDPVDVLVGDGPLVRWTHPRLEAVNTHGSGCMLSAAVAARLALGQALVAACDGALRFVHDALFAAHQLAPDVCLAGIEQARPERAPLRRQSAGAQRGGAAD